MDEPYYTYDGEIYRFFIGDTLRSECDRVAICFDREYSVLLKHGGAENVLKAYERAKAAFARVDMDDKDIVMITIDPKVPVEEINKCVQISGYIGRFYRKYGVDSVCETG